MLSRHGKGRQSGEHLTRCIYGPSCSAVLELYTWDHMNLSEAILLSGLLGPYYVDVRRLGASYDGAM